MGWSGWRALVFTPAQVVITLVLFAEASVILGIAAFPAVEVWLWISDRFPNAGAQRTLALCMGGAAAYFIFGLALLVVLPIARWVTLSIGTPVEFIERVVALAPDAFVFAVGQFFIAVALAVGRGIGLRLAVAGAVTFLVAISWLGVGAAFPTNLVLAIGAVLLWRAGTSNRTPNRAP